MNNELSNTRFTRLRCGLVFLLVTSSILADDWPTHLHDNQRSGKSAETLQLPLHLLWSHQLPRPKPAWPPPAKQDYWHRKVNLRPRIVHDRAHGFVVANGTIFVASSADDQLRAIDALTGRLLWTHFAEAPIRLAPTVWNELVVFGSDDGSVYGVDAETGRGIWRTRPDQVGSRRIPGNQRIVSERPIRSGVMVNDEGTGFFTAGIFPQQGAFFFSIDVRDGKILDHARIQKSIQGYLEERDGEMYAPTGRDPRGYAVGGKRRTKSQRATLDEGVYAVVEDTQHQFVGRQNQVSAEINDVEQWQATVEGRVYNMAVSDGRLLVSTDEGWIYAFGVKTASAPAKYVLPEPTAPKHDLEQTEVPGSGYVLYVDPTDDQVSSITSSIGRTPHQTIVTASTAERAGQLRELLAKRHVYGHVAVHEVDSSRDLPYGDKLFRRIVCDPSRDFSRHLRPNLPSRGSSAAESWTHMYGNPGNHASSTAKVGGKAMKLQWFGGPGPQHMVDRHMRTMPPLSRDGIMYIPALNRVIAVDAFTGSILWQKEIPNSTRIGILKDCGWMVAHENGLFVAVDDELLQIDSDGNNQRKPKVRFSVPAKNRHWGYVAYVGSRLLGSTTLPGAHRRTIDRAAILEGAYTDNRPIVCSDSLFAFDSHATDKEPHWHYQCNAILNPAIAANASTIYFVENDSSEFLERGGRIQLADFLNGKASLAAINIDTGEKRWSVGLPAIPGAQNGYLLCNEQQVVFINSRNAGTVHYDVRVYDVHDGVKLWSTTQDNKRKPGGDHGEQDKHPLIVGKRLIVEPFAYDLDTGSKLTEFDLTKRGYGCGTLSASAEALFFRSGTPSRYSLHTNQIKPLTSVTRPNCWINMIPANGLLLIPEGSSGCTCNYAVQTSMAFVPSDEGSSGRENN